MEIADLEALVAERPSRAATLGQAIESLRQKRANLQRSTMRRAAVPDVALPAESAYRAAVADINGALQGSNIEAARAALRTARVTCIGLAEDFPRELAPGYTCP